MPFKQVALAKADVESNHSDVKRTYDRELSKAQIVSRLTTDDSRPTRRFALLWSRRFTRPTTLAATDKWFAGWPIAWSNRGHQVEVIHDVDAYRMLAGKRDPDPLDEPSGLRVHSLRSRVRVRYRVWQRNNWAGLIFHGRTIREILNSDFDVIHFHNISLVGGPGVLAYGDAVKLYTTHEHWLVCPSHILWRHNREVCTGRQCIRCVLRHRRPPQAWRATRFLESMCRHVDAFLAPSQFCADKHREFGFHPPMHVLPNFLPDDCTDNGPADDVPVSQRPFFLFVGRLEPIKGLQEVIPLFDEDSPADLHIAGTGNYEPELRRLAAGRKTIQFLGQQSQSELRRRYRQARAVIASSICYEVFPMILLEAFREGTPVIARRLGPYPEIIEQSAGGLMFRDARELADHVNAADACRRRAGETWRCCPPGIRGELERESRHAALFGAHRGSATNTPRAQAFDALSPARYENRIYWSCPSRLLSHTWASKLCWGLQRDRRFRKGLLPGANPTKIE